MAIFFMMPIFCFLENKGDMCELLVNPAKDSKNREKYKTAFEICKKYFEGQNKIIRSKNCGTFLLN